MTDTLTEPGHVTDLLTQAAVLIAQASLLTDRPAGELADIVGELAAVYGGEG